MKESAGRKTSGCQRLAGCRIDPIDDMALSEYIDGLRAGGRWRATSWSYHSRASVLHRYVAMSVPKVACSTVKLALQTFEGCAPEGDRWWEVHADEAGPVLLSYPTGQIVEMLQSPEYLRFCFVRNPYGRLFSAWKSKLATQDPQYRELRASIRDACDYPVLDGERAGRVAFRDAAAVMFQHPGTFDDHWVPQADLLVTDVIAYDFIGRFERFTEDFQSVLTRLNAPAEVFSIASRVHNPTPAMALAAVYDRHLADRVYDHYIADFESFGYDKDSWLFD